MKNVWIVALVVLTIPLVLAFGGTSLSYKIKYAIDGMGLATGISTNYKVRSNLLYQPVGNFSSTSYKLYLGPYHIKLANATTTTTSTSTTTTISACTCTAWRATSQSCGFLKVWYRRTCTPRGCNTERVCMRGRYIPR